jgi:Zn-dependent M32 family carboxypeptidase
MKEIKSKTRSTKKKLVPWFETMGQQLGLSERTISAVLKENQSRIRKLNKWSAQHVSRLIKEGKWDNYKQPNSYSRLAMILQRCTYIPCGSLACAHCSAAKQLHNQSLDLYGVYSELGHNTVILNFKSSCYPWELSEGQLVNLHDPSWHV